MKIFRIILIAIGVIIGLFLVTTIFLPSKYSIERTTEIKAPAYLVYYNIATMKYWEHWDPWMQQDMKQKREYFGPISGTGSGYSFNSNNDNVGQGKLTLTETTPYSSIKMKLERDGMDYSTGIISISDSNGITKLKWVMKGSVSGFNKWFILFLDGMVGKSFEQGFTNLKMICENTNPVNARISKTKIDAINILFITDSTSSAPQAIGQALGKSYGEIGEFMKKNNIQMDGSPLAVNVYHSKDKYIFQAGFPVKEFNGKTEGRIQYRTIPGGNVIKAIQKGPYEQAPKVYKAMKHYVEEMEYIPRGLTFEIYKNDPMTVKPFDIETIVYFPIE